MPPEILIQIFWSVMLIGFIIVIIVALVLLIAITIPMISELFPKTK